MSASNPIRIALLVSAAVAEITWADLPSGPASASSVELWTQGHYGEADQNRRGGLLGYEAEFRGAAVGVRGQLTEGWRLGLDYRVLEADLQRDAERLGRIDGKFVRARASFAQGAYAFNLGLTHGRTEHDRGLPAGDYSGTSLGADSLFAYRYPLQGTVAVEPLLQLRYARSEAKQSQPLHEVGEVGVGLRWTGHFQAGPGRLEQRIRLMALRDYIADEQGTTTLLILGDQPLLTHPTQPRRNSYQAGLGVSYHLGSFTLSAGYDYLERSDYYANHLLAEIRYAF